MILRRYRSVTRGGNRVTFEITALASAWLTTRQEMALTVQRKEIRHPGPVDPNRIDSFEGQSRTLGFTFAPDMSLLDAVATPLAAAGLQGAGVTFRQVRFKPFRYVLPAFSPDAEHVAYYSATFAPEDEIEVTYANLTYGRNDTGPFLHCHATWRDRTGRECGGHVLPLETFVSAPGPAAAVGTEQVAMVSKFDPETNFTLFRPVAPGAAPAKGKAAPRCVLARIKPNVDLIEGIEEVCRRHRIRNALIRSGVGSIVGAEFDDGRIISEHPTEILVLGGQIKPDHNGQPRADLSIALIDTNGDLHEGKPVRERNPVLICFELVLEATD
jgi:predicted DNA-binding protein with PD1-like motif